MDQPTHYVEVRVLPLDGDTLSGGDVAFVTSRIMSCVHRHIVEGSELAVAFPKYCTTPSKAKEGAAAETIGTGQIIRLFGDFNALMSFVVRPDFAQLIGGAACSVGKAPIKQVPQNAQWEVFSRNRSVERRTEAYVERACTRLATRVENVVGLPSVDEFRERVEKEAQLPKSKLLPFVQMDSASTKRRFKLFIERKPAEGFIPKAPSTYGLGVTIPSF